MRDSEREALQKMRDGYELIAGTGLWGIHCRLVKNGETHMVHRSVFAALRNEGYVKYADNKRKPGMQSKLRLLAVLTEEGRKALEKDEVPSV